MSGRLTWPDRDTGEDRDLTPTLTLILTHIHTHTHTGSHQPT